MHPSLSSWWLAIIRSDSPHWLNSIVFLLLPVHTFVVFAFLTFALDPLHFLICYLLSPSTDRSAYRNTRYFDGVNSILCACVREVRPLARKSPPKLDRKSLDDEGYFKEILLRSRWI